MCRLRGRVIFVKYLLNPQHVSFMHVSPTVQVPVDLIPECRYSLEDAQEIICVPRATQIHASINPTQRIFTSSCTSPFDKHFFRSGKFF